MLIKPKNFDALKVRLTQRPLVLFGMGGMGQKIAAFCEANKISVACFADSNPKKQGERIIVSPEEMKLSYPDANIVISSAVYFEEIIKQTESLGYTPEQIISYKLFVADGITWKDLDKDANWERMKIRVRQLSQWIDEGVRSVADYGCGEMYLRSLLSPEVKYFPIDYICRSEDTILCDLNSGVFPAINADVAVLSGMLELLTTAKSLITHVCKSTNQKIIATYMTFENFPDMEGRRGSAYVNNFSSDVFINMFEENGFVLKARQVSLAHNVDTLFLFEKYTGNQCSGEN